MLVEPELIGRMRASIVPSTDVELSTASARFLESASRSVVTNGFSLQFSSCSIFPVRNGVSCRLWLRFLETGYL